MGGTTMVRGRLSPTTDTMATMDIMDTMAIMDMDMDTAISTARGKLMPRLITMDTMVMAMDTDTMDMDIMDIMDITDTFMDKELRVKELRTQQKKDSVPRNNFMQNFK